MVNSPQLTKDPKGIALAYVLALGKRRLGDIPPLLADDMHFKGPGGELQGSVAFMEALHRIEPTIERFDIKHVFVDGEEVCIIYDYVTPTSVGAIATVEWLRVKDGKIVSDFLVFDRVSFGAAMQEVQNAGR